MTRRDFGKVAAAGIPALMAAQNARPDSRIHGVQIGLLSYSFRDLPATEIIPSMLKIGLSEVELMSNHAEALAGLEAGQRAANPDVFRSVRDRFTNAGIDLRILYYEMPAGISDDAIDYAFRMAQALGVRIVSSSSTLSVARRVAPVTAKYQIVWATDNNDNTQDTEQFGTPEIFTKVLALGPRMAVNLDIGHFTAAGFDSVAYIREHAHRIANIHLKDRKRNPQGKTPAIPDNNFPWGQGDTPIREVLQIMKRERFAFPANIDYDYNAHAPADPVTEVTRCFEFAKMALE